MSLNPDVHLEVDEGGGEDLEGRHASTIGRLHQSLPAENQNDQRQGQKRKKSKEPIINPP